MPPGSMYSSGCGDLREVRALLEVCAQLVSTAYQTQDGTAPEDEADAGPTQEQPSLFNRKQRYILTDTAADLVVSLPGTTHPMDWGSNMNVEYQPIHAEDAAQNLPQAQLHDVPCAHRGFLKRSQTIPISALADQAAAAGKRLVFTGHSLGGAVAALCALQVLLHRDATGQGPPEVVCLAFAAPIWCNNPLARLIEAAAWHACFVNVTVPEDYCLKLFNNVLTSAAKPTLAQGVYLRSKSVGSLVLRHTTSFGSLLGLAREQLDARHCKSAPISRTGSKELQQDDEEEEEEEEGLGLGPHGDACPEGPPTDQLAVAASTRANLSSSSSGGGGGGGGGAAQHGAAAAGAVGRGWADGPGDKLRRTVRTKSGRQLRWTDPPQQGAPGLNAAALAAAEAAAAAAARGEAQGQQGGCTQQQLRQGLQCHKAPRSYGTAFAQAVHQELDAFEPFSRLYLDVSAGSEYSAASDDPDARSSDGSSEVGARETAAGWWPLTSSPSLTSLSAGSVSSSRSWRVLAYLPSMFSRSLSYGSLMSWGSNGSSVRSGQSDGAEAPGEGGAAPGAPHPGAAAIGGNNTHAMVTRSKSSSALLGGGRGAAKRGGAMTLEGAAAAVLSDHGRRPGVATQAELHMAASSALLRLLPGFAAVARTAQARVLQATMRALLATSSRVLWLAQGFASRALTVPLDVLEQGLIAVLRPPMYCSVGQQWVLTASGLLPQHQPIESYPQHPWDVFWHRELAMVAFKQHSIDFYKNRLLQHANWR